MTLTYDYTNIAPPGMSADTVTGINNHGEIVGYTPYTPSTVGFEIFTYSGALTPLSPAQACKTSLAVSTI
jgi:hypothetical protein